MPGIRLSQSRLMLISSAGSYLRDSQKPFDDANKLGDYTLRTFPSSTEFDALAYAHDHYDHQMIEFVTIDDACQFRADALNGHADLGFELAFHAASF